MYVFMIIVIDSKLFILRMNIHLVGSIVDSPEIFWSQPDLGTFDHYRCLQ